MSPFPPSKLFSLNNKVAIVTGVGPGMGRSIAVGFAAAGASVVLGARTAEYLQSVSQEIASNGGTALAVPCDVRKPEDLVALYERTMERFGKVDILMNSAHAGPNASPTGGPADMSTSMSLTKEEWLRCFEVNVYAPFRLSQLVAPGMIERKSGSIINMISDAAEFPDFPNGVAYGSTKAALTTQTRYLAKEYGPYVRVNALCPGIMTLDGAVGAQFQPFMDALPIRRAGRSDEIIGAALFLASDASSYMTAEVLRMDGGRLHARKTV